MRRYDVTIRGHDLLNRGQVLINSWERDKSQLSYIILLYDVWRLWKCLEVT